MFYLCFIWAPPLCTLRFSLISHSIIHISVYFLLLSVHCSIIIELCLALCIELLLMELKSNRKSSTGKLSGCTFCTGQLSSTFSLSFYTHPKCIRNLALCCLQEIWKVISSGLQFSCSRKFRFSYSVGLYDSGHLFITLKVSLYSVVNACLRTAKKWKQHY